MNRDLKYYACLWLLAVACIVAARLPLFGQLNGVWAVDDGERIKKTNLSHTLKTSTLNAVGRIKSGSAVDTIKLFGMRNEVVAFQLILQSGASATTNVNVTLDELTKTASPAFTIDNAEWDGDPFNYVGRHIEMFVMHYMNIDVRTNESYIWYSSSRPGGRTSPTVVVDPVWPLTEFSGLHGEQLIPFEAASGAKTNGQGGAPFTVAANQNQTVWVDVYIPRTAPSGTYHGNLVVMDGIIPIVRHTIPVRLRVYNATLPDSMSLPTTAYPDENQISLNHATGGAHPDSWTAAWYDMFRKYQQLGKRHRYNLQRSDSRVATQFGSEMLAGLTGTLFTRDSGYAGPGEGRGPELYHIGVYSQPNKSTRDDQGYKSGFGNVRSALSVVNADTASWRGYWQDAAQEWADSFAIHAPNTIVQKYGPEEASVEGGRNADTSVFYDMRRKAQWLKDGGSGIPYSFSMNFRPEAKLMMTALSDGGTFWIAPGAAGFIYSNPTFGLNPYAAGLVLDSVTNWKAAGITLGMYGGFRPGVGTMMIDAPAIDQRANPWIVWKLGLTGGFRHWLTGNGEMTAGYNPWSKDYRMTDGTSGNWGDGTFIYSGQTRASLSGDSRGLSGPIAGVRLKNWRRGAQDYEYLALATSLGIDVTAIVAGIVNKVGDQLDRTIPVPLDGWAQHGYQYESARLALAEAIESVSGLELPTGTIGAIPSSHAYGGGSSTLTWTSIDAENVTITPTIGSVGASGSTAVSVATTTTYTLTVSNSVGFRQYTATITVAAAPPAPTQYILLPMVRQ